LFRGRKARVWKTFAVSRLPDTTLNESRCKKSRAFPGCEYVMDVEVEYQIDRMLKTNWNMHVYTCEGANLERIQYAMNATRDRLRHRYDLRLLIRQEI
jgi:hypothetical protein